MPSAGGCTNGKSPVELAQVDALDADGCERVRLRIDEIEHARLMREIERQKAHDKELIRRRSTMSALEKSTFLRARIAAGRTGEEARADYFNIPW
jgi:hypothetical protein